MNDIKGLNRNYEDQVESDQVMRQGPNRPPRKGSISRSPGNYGTPTLEINGRMQRSTSELQMNNYNEAEEKSDDKKKRGRSPFRLFGKKRDQSKEKIKSKNEAELAEKRANQGRNVIHSNLVTRGAPTVTISNVSLHNKSILRNCKNCFFFRLTYERNRRQFPIDKRILPPKISNRLATKFTTANA